MVELISKTITLLRLQWLIDMGDGYFCASKFSDQQIFFTLYFVYFALRFFNQFLNSSYYILNPPPFIAYWKKNAPLIKILVSVTYEHSAKLGKTTQKNVRKLFFNIALLNFFVSVKILFCHQFTQRWQNR